MARVCDAVSKTRNHCALRKRLLVMVNAFRRRHFPTAYGGWVGALTVGPARVKHA